MSSEVQMDAEMAALAEVIDACCLLQVEWFEFTVPCPQCGQPASSKSTVREPSILYFCCTSCHEWFESKRR